MPDEALSGLLGPGASYEGDLSFQGQVRIDGHFTGALRCDDLVEVGPDGRVHGELEAAQLLIAGQVEGTLTARERCTLLPTARVVGRVVTPWLDVANGARLRAEVVVDRESTE